MQRRMTKAWMPHHSPPFQVIECVDKTFAPRTNWSYYLWGGPTLPAMTWMGIKCYVKHQDNLALYWSLVISMPALGDVRSRGISTKNFPFIISVNNHWLDLHNWHPQWTSSTQQIIQANVSIFKPGCKWSWLVVSHCCKDHPVCLAILVDCSLFCYY